MLCYCIYTTKRRTINMLIDKNRIRDICDYIDYTVREDSTVFAIQIKALKKDIERSLRKNNVMSPEIEFLIKRL